MPEVMLVDDYRFWIHEWDFDVERFGRWCIIKIGDDEDGPLVMEWGDMRTTDAGRAAWIVNECQEILLAHWRRVHGS
jgi:hypothetical protein